MSLRYPFFLFTAIFHFAPTCYKAATLNMVCVTGRKV